MTDAPDLSRAALEVLAERLEAVDHMSIEDCFLQSPLYWRAAATLRALAARVIELEAEVERLRKREKFLRGISPSVAAMLDEYDTPTDAVLATANAD